MNADERLLEQLLAEEGIALDSGPATLLHTKTDTVGRRIGPLSYAQQRLFFLDRMVQDKAAYHVAYCVHFSGALEVDRLKHAYGLLAARHPALRTRFLRNDKEAQTAVAGELLQEVVPSVELDWQEATLPLAGVDQLRGLLADTGADLSSPALQQLQAFSARAFDLAKPPLSRQCLYQLEDGSYLLQWVLHHIISDGWTRDILIADLALLYAGQKLSQGASDQSLDYIDYSIWQRSDAQASVLEHQLSFWREALCPLPEPLELPVDRPRPDAPSQRGATVPVSLAQDTANALMTLASELKTTPFVVLFGAFQVFLNRMSGQDCFLTGVPSANREREELQNMAGLFLNTLTLRADFSKPLTFSDLVTELKQQFASAQNHQSVPFERIVDDLVRHRDASRAPLVQTLFSLQPASQAVASIDTLTVEQFALPTMTSKLDLSLYLVEGSNDEGKPSFEGVFEYATELFDRETIVGFVRAYKKVLARCLQQPMLPVQRLEVLDSEDLVCRTEWMGEYLDLGSRSVLELFVAQLERQPDASAVVDNDLSLTYRELNERSDAIAGHLLEWFEQNRLEPSPDCLVGVMLPRDCDLVATLLAIFKIGCAYLPLDAEYPQQRIQYIWNDSGAALLVTSLSLSDCGLPTESAVYIDDIVTSRPALKMAANGDSSALAYVTYTSGSTGQPKGVMVEQGNVVALLEWGKTVFSKEQCQGVLFSTSVCFDLSVFEMFMPLAMGGAVLVAENALELPALAQRLDRDPGLPAVTLVNTVPSAIRVLCRQGMIPNSVKTLTLCGELLPQTVVDELYALPQIADVIDLYGPSEDTVYSTWTRREPQGRQSIGRPIANTQAYVLDAFMNQQPVGAVGELYLAGAGVARGYLHRQDLTDERFLPNPFERPCDHGNRLYRTGDLVKQLPSGDLVYLRRIDDQVKLRGYRVELSEVNHALWSSPGVEEAVAVVRKDQDGTPMLIAYVVASADSPAVERDWMQAVKDSVSSRVPAYMVPGSWVRLDALPQTPNGKVDRKALPEPQAVARREGIALSGDLQLKVAALWRELLALSKDHPLYADDDFFQLGGHSLLLLELSHRVETQWSISMPLEKIVVDTRLSCLAEAIELAALSSQLVAREPVTAESESLSDDELEQFEL